MKIYEILWSPDRNMQQDLALKWSFDPKKSLIPKNSRKEMLTGLCYKYYIYKYIYVYVCV